jgi:ribosomal protein S6--L-glutamate ligase
MSGESVGIISHFEALYSTRRFVEAALAQGLRPFRIDPVEVTVRLCGASSAVWGPGGPVEVPDLLIPRVGTRLGGFELALVRALVAAGSTPTAAPAALAWAQDKVVTTQRLRDAGVPILATVVLREAAQTDAAVQALGGLPVVVKRRVGSQGRGVWRADTLTAARAAVAELTEGGDIALIQPLVVTEPVRDLRVLVIGGEPAAACWRTAATGEFRANLHRGGRVEAAALTERTADLARQAARATELPVCGVDLLPVGADFAVLEVNASPGLEGIEAATGRDLAGDIVAWLRGRRAG